MKKIIISMLSLVVISCSVVYADDPVVLNGGNNKSATVNNSSSRCVFKSIKGRANIFSDCLSSGTRSLLSSIFCLISIVKV